MRIFVALSACALLCSCLPQDKPATVQEHMDLAVQRQLEGNVAEALRHYNDAVRHDPDNAAAHFEIAVLLQDSYRDPITAYYHLRTFLLLQPKSQKTHIATGRLEQAERDIIAIMTHRTGDTTLEGKLTAQLTELRKAFAESESALATAGKDIATLTQKNEQLEREVKRLNARISLLLDNPDAE